MNAAILVGTLAAIASTVSFAPQAIKIIRSRDTKSISIGMYAITVTGFMLWISYGVLLESWPITLSNSACLILSGFILAMKLLPDNKKVADAIEPAIGK